MTGKDWDVRSSQPLSDLNWRSVTVRLANPLNLLMFKTMRNLFPGYLTEKFAPANTVDTVHEHNVRTSDHNSFFVPG